MSYINSSLLQRFWEDYLHTSTYTVLRCNCEFIFNFLNGYNYVAIVPVKSDSCSWAV